MYAIDKTSKHCCFVSDIGFICPLTKIDRTSDVRIRAFLDCDIAIQRKAADLLWASFFKEAGLASPAEAMDYINKHYNHSDLMYVLSDFNETHLIGIVTVDRRNFHPTIAHLAVATTQRGNGYSKLLLDIAESYTKTLGFTEAQLWCDPDLVPFYIKHGYNISQQNEEAASKPTALHIMSKPLRSIIQNTDCSAGDAFPEAFGEDSEYCRF